MRHIGSANCRNYLSLDKEDVTMDDVELMRRAMALAAAVRSTTAPNPWVGCVVVAPATLDGDDDAGEPPPSRLSKVPRRRPAAPTPRWPRWPPPVRRPGAPRSTSPWSRVRTTGGRRRAPTPSSRRGCAGWSSASRTRTRWWPGVASPRSGEAGIDVTVGVAADEVSEQLAPYRKHRTTGQPWVVLKMAASLDARTAAPDGTSRWITGEARPPRRAPPAVPVRRRAGRGGHGAADDPELTVRLENGAEHAQPLRVVLGRAPDRGQGATRRWSSRADLDGVLTELGRRGVIQVLVEGGATVAHDFHAAGLVDRYVLYLAPAFFGGDDGRPLFAGPGAGRSGMCGEADWCRSSRLGEDLRVEVAA